MRSSLRHAERLLGCFLAMLFVAFSASPSLGAYSITPDISVREEYDSNINLTPDDEKSDFITTISPGFSFLLAERNIGVQLAYHLNVVRFADQSDNNYIGHLGDVDAWYRLSRHIKFGLVDHLVRSNDPQDRFSETDVRFASGRSDYTRNIVKPTMELLFARKGTLTLAYQNTYYDNSSDAIQDSRENRYEAVVTYQFNAQNALSVSGDYFDASFSNVGTGLFSSTPDFTGYDAGTQFTHTFTRHTSAFISGKYTKYDFDTTAQDNAPDEANSDYSVVSTDAGASHQFTRDFSGNFSVGYYWRNQDQGGTNGGFQAQAGVQKTGKRYAATLNYSRGQQQSYFDRQNVGFNEFNTILGTFRYDLWRDTTFNFTGAYTWEKLTDQEDVKREMLDLNANIDYRILPWLSARGGYAFLDRTSDDPGEEYTDHRVFATLTASYTWPPAMRGAGKP